MLPLMPLRWHATPYAIASLTRYPSRRGSNRLKFSIVGQPRKAAASSRPQKQRACAEFVSYPEMRLLKSLFPPELMKLDWRRQCRGRLQRPNLDTGARSNGKSRGGSDPWRLAARASKLRTRDD